MSRQFGRLRECGRSQDVPDDLNEQGLQLLDTWGKRFVEGWHAVEKKIGSDTINGILARARLRLCPIVIEFLANL